MDKISIHRQVSTKYDRKAYHRFKTGMMYHYYEKFRFLTLTGVGKNYRKWFNALRKWVRRNYGDFEYFCVRTDEGTGVLHIVFVGKYIPYDEISQYWENLTKNWSVSISLVKNEKYQGFEMTRQQKCVKYSQSKGWYPSELKKYWQRIFKRNLNRDLWQHFVLCFPESEYWVHLNE